ncbi:MAG: hypothetical protein ACKPDM_27175, partial [Dolichospermum sp.]
MFSWFPLPWKLAVEIIAFGIIYIPEIITSVVSLSGQKKIKLSTIAKSFNAMNTVRLMLFGVEIPNSPVPVTIPYSGIINLSLQFLCYLILVNNINKNYLIKNADIPNQTAN